MLRHALEVCTEKGMSEVIVGCYDDNYGSNKTILNNGGILCRTSSEKIRLNDNRMISLQDNYYRITL